MEEKPESGEQPPEREHADSGWVLRPDVPSGTGVEPEGLAKAERLTPEMRELLDQLMARVQEPDVLEVAPPDCPKLKTCGTYHLV
ncbi:hypothetical protein [Streptomyces triculaminicus]|uniref:hypothetical protein n=1 Tax=Streptomyces triculaminicus TaxID=2816232 RepID=UPI0037CDB412